MKMFFQMLFLCCVMCSVVVCNYELRARVHTYLNPESRCASCTRSIVNPVYSCCDNPVNTGVCSGEELCDTFFQYCLRPLGETGVECPQNDFIDTMFFRANTDALFDIGDIILGSSNPFVFSGVDWRGAQFYIKAKDSDLFDTGGGTKTIDSFAIDVDIEGGERLEPMVYQGRFGIAQIELSFEVVCQNEYSLPNCAACEPGSSPQCISRTTARLIPTTSATPDTPVIVATVTLPGSQESGNKADVGGIVGGVLGAFIILLVLSAVCLVVVYKLHSKRNNHESDDCKFVVTAPPLLGDNPVYAATETQSPDATITVTEEEREFDNPLYGDSAAPQEGAGQYATIGETANHSTPYISYYEPVNIQTQ